MANILLKYYQGFIQRYCYFLLDLLRSIRKQKMDKQPKCSIESEPVICHRETKIMPINVEKLTSVLQNFVSGTNDVQGAALVTPDGLSLASTLPGGMDEERVAAMSAAMLSLGDRIGNELSRGSIARIFVEGDNGYGVLTSCGEDAVLLVLASHAVKQGLLMLEIKRTVSELELLLM